MNTFFKTIILLFSFTSFFGCKKKLDVPKVSVEELHTLIPNNDIVLLDVRTPKEIAQGKISEALEADFYSDGFIEKATALIQKEQTIYVYCRSGVRSAKTVQQLQKLGFDKIYNVDGGIKAWKAKGFSITP